MSYFNYTLDKKHLLKHQFSNIDLVETSYSQMQQDMFVLSVLDGKLNGTYIEIGAHHPIGINNTYILENKFNWRGISFEIDKNLVNLFNQTRKNLCLQGDATSLCYAPILKQYNLDQNVDYLSVDIEPPNNSYKALLMILVTGCRPTVITFEHEAMSGLTGEQVRYESRNLLQSLGYTLLVKDVSNLGVGQHDLGVPYNVEDWWVIKDNIQQDIFEKLRADTVEFIVSNNTIYNL